MDDEDAEESQRLLQAQEQEHRATQRFENNILSEIFHRITKYICNICMSNAENLTYLLSWDNSDGFRYLHIGQCCKHRSYRDCISANGM